MRGLGLGHLTKLVLRLWVAEPDVMVEVLPPSFWLRNSIPILQMREQRPERSLLKVTQSHRQVLGESLVLGSRFHATCDYVGQEPWKREGGVPGVPLGDTGNILTLSSALQPGVGSLQGSRSLEGPGCREGWVGRVQGWARGVRFWVSSVWEGHEAKAWRPHCPHRLSLGGPGEAVTALERRVTVVQAKPPGRSQTSPSSRREAGLLLLP